MRTRTALLGLLALSAVLSLSACGGSSGSGSSSSPGTTAAATSAPATAGGTSGSAGGSASGAGQPVTGVSKQQLLVILEAVDPGMGTDESALVSKSQAICKDDILAGKSQAATYTAIEKTFAKGSFTPSDAEADAIYRAITASFCY